MDSHTHLVISACKAEGEKFQQEFARLSEDSCEIVVGTRPTDWDSIVHIHDINANSKSGLITGSVGLHPWFVLETLGKNINGTWLATLKKILLQNVGLQVGEIGLDKAWRPPENVKQYYKYEHQVQVFKQQLSLAGNLKKRVSVHCVKAHAQMLDILSSEPVSSLPPLIYMHSWSGSGEVTKQFLNSPGLKDRLYFGVSASVNLRGVLTVSCKEFSNCTNGAKTTACWHLVKSDTESLHGSKSNHTTEFWKDHNGNIECHPWRASKKWDKFCSMINLIPRQRLLLESDLPGFKNNLRTRKQSIEVIALVVSDCLNVDVEELMKICKSNLERFQTSILG